MFLPGIKQNEYKAAKKAGFKTRLFVIERNLFYWILVKSKWLFAEFAPVTIPFVLLLVRKL